MPDSTHAQYPSIMLGTLHIDMAIKLATKKELENLNKQWKRSLVATKLTINKYGCFSFCLISYILLISLKQNNNFSCETSFHQNPSPPSFFQVWGKCYSILFPHQMVYWCLYTLGFNLGIYELYFILWQMLSHLMLFY